MKKILFMLLTLSLTLTSCSSDSLNSEGENSKELSKSTLGVTKDFKALREQALADINQGGKIYYDAKQGVVFTVKSRSNIVIPPYSIKTKDGKDIYGTLEIDYIEIFDKSKMVVANTPTMALINGKKELLVTGGEFYLDIKYDGKQVEIANPIKVNIATSNSKADPAGMVLWNGDINSDDNLTWLPADIKDLTFEKDGQIFGGKGAVGMYDVLINNSSNFGWCNIDKLVKYPGKMTNIRVVAPSGFNHTNSSVYLAVEGEDNMLFQLDTFNSGLNSFEFYTDMIPVGLNVHLIFVAEMNGDYAYSILSTTVGNNSSYSIPLGSLTQTTSYGQVEAAILALP
jgi:hypothetical protein